MPHAEKININLIKSAGEEVLRNLRDVPDFPKPGIIFKDITPILSNPKVFNSVIDALAELLKKYEIDCIAGIEARGFLFGTPLASQLNLPFIPIRKPGKLPWKKKSISYSLEYGEATIEMHEDALEGIVAVGQKPKVAIIDDLLATGGTMEASCKLIKELGGEPALAAFVVELGFLDGQKVLSPYTKVESLAVIS